MTTANAATNHGAELHNVSEMKFHDCAENNFAQVHHPAQSNNTTPTPVVHLRDVPTTTLQDMVPGTTDREKALRVARNKDHEIMQQKSSGGASTGFHHNFSSNYNHRNKSHNSERIPTTSSRVASGNYSKQHAKSSTKHGAAGRVSSTSSSNGNSTSVTADPASGGNNTNGWGGAGQLLHQNTTPAHGGNNYNGLPEDQTSTNNGYRMQICSSCVGLESCDACERIKITKL